MFDYIWDQVVFGQGLLVMVFQEVVVVVGIVNGGVYYLLMIIKFVVDGYGEFFEIFKMIICRVIL